MADNKVNSGLLEFSEDQKVFVALDAETSEVKKAVTIDGDGVETDMLGVQPTGKKEITSTAEVNVANYATAQVVDEDLVAGNIKKDVDILGVVGSYEPEAPASDFSTASVTVVTSGVVVYIPYIAEAEGDLPATIVNVGITESGNYTAPMYKGTLAGTIAAFGRTVQVTGAAEWVSESETIIITGDCTITVTSET